MNRIVFSSGFLAGEVLVQAGMLWAHSAIDSGWLLAGGISIAISVQRLADDIFARLTDQVDTFPSTME